MCGRISQRGKREAFKDYIYHFDPGEDLNRSNIKPTQYIPIVIADDAGVATVEGRWWFQQHGAKEFATKYTTFNARAEKIESSFLFKPSLKHRRCLVPVTSFYEWNEKGKPPFEIFANHAHPFALAGLWSTWYEDKQKRYSCTIITCEPNEFMKSIHNRMPVILGPLEAQENWLVRGGTSLLVPFVGEMSASKLSGPIEKCYPDGTGPAEY